MKSQWKKSFLPVLTAIPFILNLSVETAAARSRRTQEQTQGQATVQMPKDQLNQHQQKDQKGDPTNQTVALMANPLEKLDNLNARMEKLDELIEKEKKELAYYESMKGKECTDQAKPCVWQDVMEASKAQLDELEQKSAALEKKEDDLCKKANERMQKRHDRWADIIARLQPIQDEIKKKKEYIETLKRRQKETSKENQRDFQIAVQTNERELSKMKSDLAEKYSNLAGPAVAMVPGLNKAKLLLARIDNKKARVATQCPQEAQAINGVPASTDQSRRPASSNGDGNQ